MNLLSPPDVAELYGIPLRTVQWACSSGTMPATKLRRMWLINPDDAAKFAENWTPHKRNGHNGHEKGTENGNS